METVIHRWCSAEAGADASEADTRSVMKSNAVSAFPHGRWSCPDPRVAPVRTFLEVGCGSRRSGGPIKVYLLGKELCAAASRLALCPDRRFLALSDASSEIKVIDIRRQEFVAHGWPLGQCQSRCILPRWPKLAPATGRVFSSTVPKGGDKRQMGLMRVPS
jgi:hypothetical protein